MTECDSKCFLPTCQSERDCDQICPQDAGCSCTSGFCKIKPDPPTTTITPTQCQFSRDCKNVNMCQHGDACFCKFGTCEFYNDAMMADCTSYKDCACKEDPENCFCWSGGCLSDPAKKFECHETIDCNSMAKCMGISCICIDDLCEDGPLDPPTITPIIPTQPPPTLPECVVTTTTVTTTTTTTMTTTTTSRF